MSCCKDNLLVYLSIEPEQKSDTKFVATVVESLKELLEYTEEQSLQAVEYAKKHGKCLVLEGTKTEVSAITLEFAKRRIGADVKTKSIK